MTTALQRTPAGGAITANGDYFTRTQIDTIKAVLCRGITDAELNLFSEVCKKTGLDPFAKQIYPIKRSQWDAETRQSVEKLTIQTGIDGYRLIAERTGKYQGQDPFQWCGEDGVWVDVWTRKQPPVAAKATVFREGFVRPLVRIARWGAYVQTKKDGSPVKMWENSGPEQLAKCAEALALRTAFPQELSGLYTAEEMDQADNEPVRASVVSRAPANALQAANKPASVPPPPPDEPAAAPTNTAAARFQWKASDEWNGKPLIDAPTDTLVEYSDYLAAVVHSRKGTKAATQASTFLLEAEAEIALRLEAERKQGPSIGDMLQGVVDASHPAEDDAKGSWLDPEAV
jgi:phage recombination protein Bet